MLPLLFMSGCVRRMLTLLHFFNDCCEHRKLDASPAAPLPLSPGSMFYGSDGNELLAAEVRAEGMRTTSGQLLPTAFLHLHRSLMPWHPQALEKMPRQPAPDPQVVAVVKPPSHCHRSPPMRTRLHGRSLPAWNQCKQRQCRIAI